MTPREAVRQVPETSRDEWEEQYRSGRWDYLAGGPEQARYAALCEHILTAGAAAVLDVGCGTGVLRDCLGTRFTGRYVGVDWSHAALASRNCGPGETLICADASRLPLRGRFDAVVLSEVLYYLDEPLAAVRRMLDLVAPGGQLLISLYQPPADRHPGWHALMADLDRGVRSLSGTAHQLVTGGGRRRWLLYVLTREAQS
ncbi:class I SAM-dependent methyltransferase [Streptacidiphilus sp. PB12-B1b]|uniref:class I SAM-dependent methyltransferase n=1 Tax=Streptacidiphilus sp. PB12-B1b TaxID=2705012 RepID=UPI0015FD9285|nr:class I SAM-dependent methyltransferase [Streptacidiphilus sp. PB12-B1b]QMU78216.1 class I SAM-dependent methyltransferase [Streptacidiphilus sp. PB12-B1b]